MTTENLTTEIERAEIERAQADAALVATAEHHRCIDDAVRIHGEAGALRMIRAASAESLRRARIRACCAAGVDLSEGQSVFAIIRETNSSDRRIAAHIVSVWAEPGTVDVRDDADWDSLHRVAVSYVTLPPPGAIVADLGQWETAYRIRDDGETVAVTAS